MHHRAKDLSGLRVGFLTVTTYAGSNGKKSLWHTLCLCGATPVHAASELEKWRKRGANPSCGCQRKKSIGASQTTHGMSNHKAFAVWRSMLDRCRLPTHQAWARYGGRGIEVCPEWQGSFAKFWADMGPTYREGLTLERRDNNAGYRPTNCCWTSRKAQARNTRVNRRADTPWGFITVAEIAEKTGLNVTTLLYRLSRGVRCPLLISAPDSSRKFSIY